MKKSVALLIGLGAIVLTGVLMAQNACGVGNKTWGSPYGGQVAVFAYPTQAKYKVGEKIGIAVEMKNFGTETVRFAITSDFIDYRLSLYDENGAPVSMTPKASNAEKQTVHEFTMRKAEDIAPGKEFKAGRPLILNEWFDIKKPGVYRLVVMRQVGVPDTPPVGYAMSNLVKIVIEK